MNFESLANELLLDIFEYFNAIQVLRTFHGLNLRFDNLLYQYFQTFPLDFRSVSKQDFDNICQRHLPLISHQITSIHLSNDDDTSEQPNLFVEYGFHFQQFPKLQSLSLYHIHSAKLINKIILDCPHLIYLNINKCRFDDDEMETAEICINNIWHLTNLKKCYLDIYFFDDFNMPLSAVISSSLEDLSIQNYSFSLSYLKSLFKCTPNLRNLNIRIEDIPDSEQLLFMIPSLTKLTVYFSGTLDSLRNLLENMPNLLELIIEMNYLDIDGYQWEDIIRSYLCKLKVLKFLMYNEFDIEKNREEKIDRLLESFQTKFWLNEHQWFVRCDYHTEHGTPYLYTLPYGFQKFQTYYGNMSKSTCLMDKISDLFNHVNILTVDKLLLTFASEFSIQFSNLCHLELSFPFDDILWSVIPKFHRLNSLEIISAMHPDQDDLSISRLCLLINRAIHLYSLTIDYLIISQLSAVGITNKSIHRLDLMTNDGHFYGIECISLIQLLLGDQCEILLINIETRSIVLDLIEKIFNLRALNFQCQDDTWGDSNESLLMEDELIQWFKHRLPSTCSIVRDQYEICVIRLWIR